MRDREIEGQEMVPISVRLRREELESVDRLAAVTYRKRVDVIRYALAQLVAAEAARLEEERQEGAA